jgi:hypothetical protein
VFDGTLAKSGEWAWVRSINARTARPGRRCQPPLRRDLGREDGWVVHDAQVRQQADPATEPGARSVTASSLGNDARPRPRLGRDSPGGARRLNVERHHGARAARARLRLAHPCARPGRTTAPAPARELACSALHRRHHVWTFHIEDWVDAHTLSHGRDLGSSGPARSIGWRWARKHPDAGCCNTVFIAQAQSAASVRACCVRAVSDLGRIRECVCGSLRAAIARRVREWAANGRPWFMGLQACFT